MILYYNINAMKNIIINADDFGHSVNKNEAIKLGVQSGIITSTSIITNMPGFEQAVNEVLPEIPFVDLGFHFNIMEGKSLTNPSMLVDNNGFFNRNYIEIMINSNSKKFQQQLKTEFKAQIERILQYKHISHVDSHVHTHAIPPIFNIVSELAKEYKIPFIRTQNEIPYKVPSISLNHNYFTNLIKNILLNTFTFINKKSLCNLSTNDYFIGVLYTGSMTAETILEGLKKIPGGNSTTEIIFHPSLDIESNPSNTCLISKYPFIKVSNNNKKNREFEITQNVEFGKELQNQEYLLTTFTNIS